MKEKKHYVLINISIQSCVTIHYIVEEIIFLLLFTCFHYRRNFKASYCFNINGKQKIIMPKKGEYVKFKNFERKIESPFMIYADFESILVSEYNGKQNPNESCTNKCQKHVAYSYGYKLVCADDKFSTPFKLYLGKDAVYNFISSMIEESKYCSDVMKKHHKEPVMTNEDSEDFKNSTKCWICDNGYIDGDVKVSNLCQITEQYRGSAKGDCNINVKSNHDSHLNMQELGKFSLKKMS